MGQLLLWVFCRWLGCLLLAPFKAKESASFASNAAFEDRCSDLLENDEKIQRFSIVFQRLAPAGLGNNLRWESFVGYGRVMSGRLGHVGSFYGGILWWNHFMIFPWVCWWFPSFSLLGKSGKKTSEKSMVSPCFPRNHGGKKVHDSSANATAWNVLQCHVGNLSVVGKTMENLNKNVRAIV